MEYSWSGAYIIVVEYCPISCIKLLLGFACDYIQAIYVLQMYLALIFGITNARTVFHLLTRYGIYVILRWYHTYQVVYRRDAAYFNTENKHPLVLLC